jgi:isoleucyl-tRNA synthetase
MPPLERYILAKIAELDDTVRAGYSGFDFNRVHTELFNFCTNELSAFYFDIRKDVLYCDRADSPRRRAARTTIVETFRRVVIWFAPILCFTMEEAWHCRYGDEEASVHLQEFPATSVAWSDERLIRKWERIRALRRVVTGALEVARRDKMIGASLEAAPVLYVSNPEDAALFEVVDLAEIAITSGATISLAQPPADVFRLADVPGTAVQFQRATGRKCARCWMILPEVGTVAGHDDLCCRCSEAVEALEGVSG